jgi:gliding motility-associated-like protein
MERLVLAGYYEKEPFIIIFEKFLKLVQTRIVIYLAIWIAGGLVAQPAAAQFCSGSGGDTVIYNSFGTGDLPQPAVKGMVPGYFFDYYNRCPGPQAYSVLNFTYDCFGYSWHNVEVNNDHTPNDVNGCFLLVNCGVNPGLFYKDTLKNLTGGKTYELSFWTANLMKPPFCNGSPVPNNMTLIAETLNGTLLGSFNSGVLPNTNTLTWKQLALTFSVPSNTTDIVIKMVDNAGGACGNDFVIDDWVVRECGQPNVKAGFNFGNFQGDTAKICIRGAATVSMNLQSPPPFANTVYQWQESNDLGITWADIAGATNAVFTTNYSVPDTILLRVRLADPACLAGNKPNCYVFSNALILMITAGASYTVTTNSPVCKGQDIILAVTGTANSYTWTGPNNFSASGSSVTIPNAAVSSSGKYYVAIITSSQCTQYDSALVSIGALPLVDAGPDKIITLGSSVQLNGSTSAAGAVYDWNPKLFIDNPAIATPTVTPPVEMPYTLTVTAAGGCGSATDEVIVKVKGPVSIPNAFTPNGDGNNDTWKIRGLSAFSDAQVSVYNRYGQLVFSHKGYYNAPWDGRYKGKILPSGTYFYVIKIGEYNYKPLTGALTIIQ